MMTTYQMLFVVLSLMTLLTNTAGAAQSQIVGEPIVNTVTLGIVSEQPGRRMQDYRDFVRYVAERLSSSFDMTGNVVVARTPLQLATFINEKKIDFYMESPYPTFVINEATGAKLLLRRWKGGRAEYRSLIFTSKNDGIKRIEDLLGKTIAFEDPGSTTGYFLPKTLFHRRGFKLTEKPSFNATVSAKEIGYLFAHGYEQNVRNWVLLRKVAAGAFSDEDLDDVDHRQKNEITILAETESLPRHIVSVRKDMDLALVSRLKDILLTMHQDERGKKVIMATQRTSKFDVLPGGEEKMYQQIRELFRVFDRRELRIDTMFPELQKKSADK
jgi:phosphonate transport system substrate-binding protein